MSWCSDAPEDEVISLFAGLLDNPDMTLSLTHIPYRSCNILVTAREILCNSQYDITS
jgi:hypothetical protein